MLLSGGGNWGQSGSSWAWGYVCVVGFGGFFCLSKTLFESPTRSIKTRKINSSPPTF